MAKKYNFVGAEERRLVSVPPGVEFTAVPDPPAAAPPPTTPVNGGRVTLAVSDELALGDEFDHLASDADFVLVACTIRLSCGANGTIDPAVDTEVLAGDLLEVTITPGVGYHVDVLLVDGVEETPAGSYTFTDVQDVHTLHVTFAAD